MHTRALTRSHEMKEGERGRVREREGGRVERMVVVAERIGRAKESYVERVREQEKSVCMGGEREKV